MNTLMQRLAYLVDTFGWLNEFTVLFICSLVSPYTIIDKIHCKRIANYY